MKHTLKEICATGLIHRNYDGLCKDGCGCRLPNIMPCGTPTVECEAGYVRYHDNTWTIEPKAKETK